MINSLDSIPNGTTVLVKNVKASDLKVKLLEMGFSEGKQLRVLYRAPLGDPMAIDIGGYVLSLRNVEAAQVEVEIIENLQE
ncbi:MAG: FeoA family protein [Crocinitomicaceae bacterium]|nr:FeoA family protein [Crocinitomicaceae bacterium]